MNRYVQNLFLVVYPFYPLWAWITGAFVHFPVEKILIILLLPFIINIVWNQKVRMPGYLWFFLFFVIYHLCSVGYNNLLPLNTSWPLFIFSDMNVLAFAIFFVVENTNFDDAFIEKMNKHILWIVALSLVVTIIQVKKPTFMFNTILDEEGLYSDRNSSIYSWVSLNSCGVTFPILVAILLNFYDTSSKEFGITTVSGIIVSFLTKARFVMISTILAFMQLLLVKTIRLQKKLLVIGLFVGGIFAIIGVAQLVGYDINKTINERILEKDTDMGSAKTRLLSYDVFLLKFPENPYFGVGPKTRDDVVDLLGGEAPIIHVGFLSYLYFYGYFGAIPLFMALLLMLWDAWVIGRRHEFWGSFYGLLGFTLANFTFVYFNFSEMGIALAIIYMRYYKTVPERLYV